MQRHEIINEAIARLGYQRYLEIGVEQGHTFNKVNAATKVAVDPAFVVPQSELLGESYQVTSDDFYDANSERTFDLVFVDGLHVFEQALRDVLRADQRLTAGGLILIDDCYPSDAVAADRSHEACVRRKVELGHPDRNWMGDVYKTALFIHDFCDHLDFALLSDSMGIVAVWREARTISPWFSDMQALADCSYEDFVGDFAVRMPKLSIDAVILKIEASRR